MASPSRVRAVRAALLMPRTGCQFNSQLAVRTLRRHLGRFVAVRQYQGLYMHSNHRLGHLFSAKKCVGVFVRMNADQFSLRSFVSFASASLYLPFQPACNFLLSLHQLVRDQQHTNIPQFINVGPNVSPTVSQ